MSLSMIVKDLSVFGKFEARDSYEKIRYKEINYRSRRPKVFCKKGVLKNFAKFTGKHLCQSIFFNQVARSTLQLYLKRYSGSGVLL